MLDGRSSTTPRPSGRKHHWAQHLPALATNIGEKCGLAGVYILFFLSGISALVYQVIWVRQFGIVFGKTVYSASLVTAVFMCGLGLGSYAAGRFADRRYRENPNSLLKIYAVFEIGIGLFGAFLAFVLPRLEPISAAFSSYAECDNGWHVLSLSSQVIPYLIAIVLLLPVTCLMGGTLTLLIRHLVRRDLSLTGSRVGALYGLNTAGAALGAFLVDFLLVPRLGLSGAQIFAVAVNLIVGVIALSWASRLVDRDLKDASSPSTRIWRGDDRDARRLLAATGLAIFLSGLAGMGMEILWFRYLISVLGSNRATFSLLLSVILVGMWIGSMLSNRIQKRLGHPAIAYMGVQILLALSSLLLFFLFSPDLLPAASLVDEFHAAPPLIQPFIEVWAKVRVILFVVGLPAILMGFAYPLANIIVQITEASVGTRAGVLYLANTLGAVLGALVTGFVLLPTMGIQPTAAVLATCSVATIWPLQVAFRASRRAAGNPDTERGRMQLLTVRILAAVAGIALIGWMLLPPQYLANGLFQPQSDNEELVCLSEGIGETIWITQGQGREGRNLYTNGHPMSGTSYDAQRYMRAFVHIPLLQHREAENVLVICFGVGNTVHAASLHPSVQSIEVVDLSRHVLEHADYFARWNKNVLADPRVEVFINDGRQHLRMRPPGLYDLVTLEPPPINHAGVATLYSVEFYELVRSRLKSGGFLTQWLPAHQVPDDVCGSIVGAFVDVFPNAVLLSGFESELILMGRKDMDPLIDPVRLVERLRSSPSVSADLRKIDLGTPVDIVGAFAGPADALRAAAKGTRPISDDYPIMEYSVVTFRESTVPKALFDVDAADQWCPMCFTDGRATLSALGPYLEAMRGYYASLDRNANNPGDQKPLTYVALEEKVFSDLRRDFPYLRHLYGPP